MSDPENKIIIFNSGISGIFLVFCFLYSTICYIFTDYGLPKPADGNICLEPVYCKIWEGGYELWLIFNWKLLNL
jgi:hypothetical protein